MNTASPAFKNELVRQAVNWAIDRTGSRKQLGYRPGMPTDKYLPPQIAGQRGREEHLPADRRPDQGHRL